MGLSRRLFVKANLAGVAWGTCGAPGQRANLTVWAGLNAPGTKLQNVFNDAVAESGSHVTYKFLGNDSFVISGIEDGKIFYRKTLLTKDLFSTFILTTPRP